MGMWELGQGEKRKAVGVLIEFHKNPFAAASPRSHGSAGALCVCFLSFEKQLLYRKQRFQQQQPSFFSSFFWKKLFISLVLRLSNKGGSFSKTSLSLSSAFKMEFTCN